MLTSGLAARSVNSEGSMRRNRILDKAARCPPGDAQVLFPTAQEAFRWRADG
jgi:hypothetical protein